MLAEGEGWSAVSDPQEGPPHLYRADTDWLQLHDLGKQHRALPKRLLDEADRKRRFNDYIIRHGRVWPKDTKASPRDKTALLWRLEVRLPGRHRHRYIVRMRVYHFLNRQYGLKDLRERRLKVARLEEINDPFELLPACASSDVRARFRAFRRDVSKTVGLICFSKTWNDPVQWSHYAEKHQGLCLGFDTPDEALMDVRYRRQRMKADVVALNGSKEESQAELKRWFTTKFAHWKYEQEVRAFLILTNMVPEDGIYYVDFDDETRLRQVIVGDSSDLTRADINDALGDLAGSVEVFKARLAFRSYRVVRQRKSSMW